jgi:hypothetical protein
VNAEKLLEFERRLWASRPDNVLGLAREFLAVSGWKFRKNACASSVVYMLMIALISAQKRILADKMGEQ